MEDQQIHATTAVTTQGQYEQDLANLDQARVNQYAAMTAFKKVTAPYDGVITTRDIDIGNLVTAGSTANTTPLYRMSQDDPLRAAARR